MRPSAGKRDALTIAVGIAAIAAPALHVLSDVMEWGGGGFSAPQLWINYIAFLPMSWLLLGIHAVHDPRPHAAGLVGAILYGAAFSYFTHSTLLAIEARSADYAALWRQLGVVYTLHGVLMVVGGLLFAWATWRAARLPRLAVALFACGVLGNLALALLPVPEIAQTIASLIRNLGLIAMGAAILAAPARRVSSSA